MPSPARAHRLLSLLPPEHGNWAFLHGEQGLAYGELGSDLDLIVRSDPRRLVSSLVGPARAAELLLVMVTRYDVYSWASIWSAPDGREMVTLDFTSDPLGHNKYGIRTSALLAGSVQGERYPRLSAIDEYLYLVAKRLYKGMTQDAAELRSNPPADLGTVLRRAASVMSNPTARAVVKFLEGGTYRRPARRHDLRRWPDRLVTGAGHIFAVCDTDLERARSAAVEAAEVLVAGLPDARPVPLTSLRPSRAWLATRRATVMLGYGRQSDARRLRLPALSTVDVVRQVTMELHKSTTGRWHRWMPSAEPSSGHR